MAARAWVRKARGRLLWLLAGFALCQAALAVAVDGWLGAVRDPEHAAKLRRLKERLAEAPDRPFVLALGSSRTAYGLDARRASGADGAHGPFVFNFGLMGGGPLLQAVTLQRLLAEGIRPDLLCVEVIPALLLEAGGRLMEEKMLDGARLCGGEALRLRDDYHEPRRLLWGWSLGRLLPRYRHQAEFRDQFGLDAPDATGKPNDPERVDSHGWRARGDEVSEAARRQTTQRALKQYAEFCASAHVAAEPVRALEELLRQCRREGIPVMLVVMPEGSPFRALYSPAAGAACARVLARLEARWGAQVVDARAWVADGNFWDAHHMLPAGARQFTDRFAREVLSPALAGLPPRQPCVCCRS